MTFKKPSETLLPKKGPIKLMKSGILGDDTESLFSSTSVMNQDESRKFVSSKIMAKPETPSGLRPSGSSNVY